MIKITLLSSCLAISWFSAYYGHSLFRDNSDAVTIVTTVITVFAGFLVAIIAVLGDPTFIPKGSWRKAEARHAHLEAVIIRHTWLFYVYLLAIGFLFVGTLIRKEPDAIISIRLKSAIEFAYMFLAVFSFLLTLAIPTSLAKIQMARSEAEIEGRRASEGIQS